MADTIEFVKKVMGAVFALFAAGALIAEAAGAPSWVTFVVGAIALAGASNSLVMVFLERSGKLDDIEAERERDRARLEVERAEASARLEVERKRERAKRFDDAVKLLGAADARVGGIFSLEQIMGEAPGDYHRRILQQLCMYIRAQSPWLPGQADKPIATSKRRPPPDVQAALDVLGQRDHNQDPAGTEIRLSDVDLRGANLRGGHFERASFRRANLGGASLEGAHFEGAVFRDAWLERSALKGAHLEGARFPGSHLERADLRDAHLKRTDLSSAYVDGVKLKGVVCDSQTRWPDGFDLSALENA